MLVGAGTDGVDGFPLVWYQTACCLAPNCLDDAVNMQSGSVQFFSSMKRKFISRVYLD